MLEVHVETTLRRLTVKLNTTVVVLSCGVQIIIYSILVMVRTLGIRPSHVQAIILLMIPCPATTSTTKNLPTPIQNAQDHHCVVRRCSQCIGFRTKGRNSGCTLLQRVAFPAGLHDRRGSGLRFAACRKWTDIVVHERFSRWRPCPRPTPDEYQWLWDL